MDYPSIAALNHRHISGHFRAQLSAGLADGCEVDSRLPAFQVVSRKLSPPDPMSMEAESLPRLCTGDAVCSGKHMGSQTPAPLREQAPLTQSTMRVLLTSSRCWRSLAAMATELK